eukprot:1124743-Pelagomonas_calceolata.AAC.10
MSCDMGEVSSSETIKAGLAGKASRHMCETMRISAYDGNGAEVWRGGSSALSLHVRTLGP